MGSSSSSIVDQPSSSAFPSPGQDPESIADERPAKRARLSSEDSHSPLGHLWQELEDHKKRQQDRKALFAQKEQDLAKRQQELDQSRKILEKEYREHQARKLHHKHIDGQWKQVQKELERQAAKSRELSRLEEEQEMRKQVLELQAGQLLAEEEDISADDGNEAHPIRTEAILTEEEEENVSINGQEEEGDGEEQEKSGIKETPEADVEIATSSIAPRNTAEGEEEDEDEEAYTVTSHGRVRDMEGPNESAEKETPLVDFPSPTLNGSPKSLTGFSMFDDHFPPTVTMRSYIITGNDDTTPEYDGPKGVTQVRPKPVDIQSVRCSCRIECSARCSCFKNGLGCTASCKCKACTNLLNGIGDLFWAKRHQATPCFLGFLKNNDDLDFHTAENQEELRAVLFGVQPGNMDDAPKDELFSGHDGGEEYEELAIRWTRSRAMDENSRLEERKQVTKEIFKLGLAIDKTRYGRSFFSFCRNKWEQDSHITHCTTCGQCKDWREWHCKNCRKCTEGICKCGGVSASNKWGRRDREKIFELNRQFRKT
ncbi:hypothetical protein E2P81_ATG06253 [Venturia nashicola]|uniref:Tesmin/TSO1-like CXC domain-containing protein n=1 Tax=Venturia nashicola TaxID=86259 RepID=A0A4Z1NRK3_9PEZI|nr:hypothetical protein E6O75_ATG06397 [Venturia nashicola]TLD27907.1 hypothetical protein E2P81_ATG06253 [Venturia nashicola]